MPDGARPIDPVLDVRGLKTVFRIRAGEVHAVNEVSFHLAPGELLGVVGESGSGKSVTMMSLLGLLPSPPAEIRAGSVMFDGQDLLKIDANTMRGIRGGKIGFVFQDPMTSLNPVFQVGFQIMEPLRKHLGLSKSAARKRAQELLELVGIPAAADRLNDYPHQFSGGMRQRVMIAIALACDPKVLIADEPTTALDVTIQAQILELMQDLQRELGTALILITHDLGIVAETAQRVIVMYAGRKVEEAGVEDLFELPLHPYTLGLMASIPRLPSMRGQSAVTGARLNEIPGMVPALTNLPSGCIFAPRCAMADQRGAAEYPPYQEKRPGHWTACWHADRLAGGGNA